MNEYLTVTQASEMLNLSSQNIKRLIKIGKLPAMDVSAGEGQRKNYRIRLSDINKLQIKEGE